MIEMLSLSHSLGPAKWPHGLLRLSITEPCKKRNLQNGSKSTNHREERDLLTSLNLFYSFSKTSATFIDGSEKAAVDGDLNFGFYMLLKRPVRTLKKQKNRIK